MEDLAGGEQQFDQILSSVGRNASNRLPDTKVIQSMLNFIDPESWVARRPRCESTAWSAQKPFARSAPFRTGSSVLATVLSVRRANAQVAGQRLCPERQRRTQDLDVSHARQAFRLEHQDVWRVRFSAPLAVSPVALWSTKMRNPPSIGS